jgi:hypothetical protein
MIRHLVTSIVMVIVICFAVTARAIDPAQLFTFEDGSTSGWTNGRDVSAPQNVASGGPNGVDDNYLQITSDFTTGGGGPGSKLVAFNRSVMLGDYVSAGISAIEMDLKNLTLPAGSGPLSMRWSFMKGAGLPGYVSAPFSLVNDGAWHKVTFLLTPANFTGVLDPTFPLSELLSNANNIMGEVRILHATGATYIGDDGDFRVGLDNLKFIVRGDWNRNSAVDVTDIQAMLAGLTDLAAYKTAKNLNNESLLAIGDFNNDGFVTNRDIQPMLNFLASSGLGSIATVPEPASAILAIVAVLWGCALEFRRRPLQPRG